MFLSLTLCLLHNLFVFLSLSSVFLSLSLSLILFLITCLSLSSIFLTCPFSLLFSLLPFILTANQSHAASPRAGGNKGDDATGETVRVQEDVPYGAVQYVQ